MLLVAADIDDEVMDKLGQGEHLTWDMIDIRYHPRKVVLLCLPVTSVAQGDIFHHWLSRLWLTNIVNSVTTQIRAGSRFHMEIYSFSFF